MKKFLPALLIVSSVLAFAPVHAAEGVLDVHIASLSRGSVPRGAQRVEMLRLGLSANCSADVTIDEIVVHHEGLGDVQDIERVYALSGLRRVSRARSFSGNGETATLRLGRFVVKACGQEDIMIVIDFARSAASGAEHRLVIEKDDISTDAGSVEVGGNESSTPIGIVPSDVGAIEVTYPPITSSVSYGRGRTVGRIALEADGESDHAISSITLTNEGTARGHDLQHLRLRLQNGTYVGGTIASLTDDLVRFSFDPPLLLEKNEMRTLNVIADVRASRRKTIRLEVDEPSDIEATVRKQRGGRFQ